MRNIILAGIPRSGSTLACHLINKMADAVALCEPMDVTRFQGMRDRTAILDEICGFFESMRRSITENQTAFSKHVGGTIPMNPVGNERTDAGLRQSSMELGEIVLNRPLSKDFVLVVKHNAAFAALLPDLVTRFRTFALIRNPVSVLSSWNTVSMPVRDGHAPAAEGLESHLQRTLETIPHRLDRQVFLLSWFFEQFGRYLPEENIIRYEDLIATNGQCLRAMVPSCGSTHEPLASRNENPLYDPDLTPDLVERLTSKSDASYWRFYRPGVVRSGATS